MECKQRFLCFRIDGERYAIEEKYLVRILQACECYKVPRGEPWVMGLIVYENDLCGVLDYKQKNFQEGTKKPCYYIIIQDGYEKAGICATEVEGYQSDLESDVQMINIQALI